MLAVWKSREQSSSILLVLTLVSDTASMTRAHYKYNNYELK
jgi:hypothetical protein